MLDMTDRTAVIIGGGAVAARKARGLLEAGAKVRCVSPAFAPEISDLVERIWDVYHPHYLGGAVLVFAATDNPEVNNAIVRDARARNILVNRADTDDDHPGDFVVPASHRAGNILTTVSATSPAISAMIRDKVAENFDPRWRELADVMVQLRPAIVGSGLEIARRRQIFRDLATNDALDVLGKRGPEGLRRWLYSKYPELENG